VKIPLIFMKKEIYNKYKGKIDFFYNTKNKIEVSCIYCFGCKKYLPDRFFPYYGIVNEYKKDGGLCTDCYTKKHSITQDFLEEILDTQECCVCGELKKKLGTRGGDFHKYRNQEYSCCNSCHELKIKAKKLKNTAITLLKSQGIENITEEHIKTKELILTAKREIKKQTT
jgi:hypothetical protein